MKKNRILLFLFIPLLVYILLSSKILFLIFTEIVVCCALYELYNMFLKKQKNVYFYPGLIICFIFPILVYFNFMTKVSLTASAFIVAVSGMLIDNEKKFTEKLSLTFFGIMYIPIWACDTFAYLVGSRIGKHKFTKISPNKSIEGVIGGFFGVLIISYIFKYFVPKIFFGTNLAILSVLLTIVAVFGDLFESKIKRDLDVKDSSTILGGHGGFLDRFDSALFVIPFVYYYWRLVCFTN